MRVLLGRVFQRGHVHRVHLHAAVGQEVVDDQHQAREPGPRGQELAGVHRRGRRVALAEEHDAEEDQHRARDQRADDQAAAGQARDALGAARGDPHAGPVDDHDHAGRPDAVAGERGVDHVGERARHEPEQARVVEDRHRELAPHGQEAHGLRDALRPSCRRRPSIPTPARRTPATSAAGRRSRGRGRGRRTRGRRRPSSARPAGWPPSWWSSGRARPRRCTRWPCARRPAALGRHPGRSTSAGPGIMALIEHLPRRRLAHRPHATPRCRSGSPSDG